MEGAAPASANGDADLLAHFKLDKVYTLAMTLQPNNYLQGVPAAGELRRGPGMELAPLAAIYAPAKRPAIAPLSATMLEGLALLQPGKYTPPEEVLGVPLVTTLRSEPNERKKNKKRKGEDKEEKRPKRKKASQDA